VAESLDRKYDFQPAIGHLVFCLKGQSHEKVCEIMTWDARIGLN
jgi:hypothetical protein